MKRTSLPLGFEEIRREEQARAFGRLMRVRYLVHPVFAAIALYIVISDFNWYRAVALVGAILLMLALMLIETSRIRRRGVSDYRIGYRDLSAVVFALLCLALFSGGTRSPFVLAMLAVLVAVAILQGRRVATVVLACFLAFLWALVLVQSRVGWMMPRIFHDAAGRLTLAYDVVDVVLMSVVAVTITAFGLALGAMSDSMLARSLEARSETLRLHGERLTELMTFSGELAHELKNPLANMKGLAHLIEAEPSRGRERLEILKLEMDRMRAVLDEFLNFSRPLVPLSQQIVDLADLCRDVVALHEGLAGARHLMLIAPGDGIEVRCDPRKTKQILVNLVQNALEATPDGGEIRVDVGRLDGFAAVRVMDRGCGIPFAIADRAFEAGVTSKATGSGLGLTIARTLTEQHGGKLSLSNREGGGCVAEVLLPMRGTAATAGGPPT